MGFIGWGFKTVLYRMEDVTDRSWRGRPHWARPAVGGLALGALLLVLPQMYGVGYPVMDRAIDGRYVLWLLVILLFAKMLATSLTLSIGGSGGIFAPSLLIGSMTGMVMGIVGAHLFGHAVGSPARVLRRRRHGRRLRCSDSGSVDGHRERTRDDGGTSRLRFP